MKLAPGSRRKVVGSREPRARSRDPIKKRGVLLGLPILQLNQPKPQKLPEK